MTDIGYKDIINRITGNPIITPNHNPATNEDMTAEQLYIWMCGYMACMNEAVATIEELMKGPRD